MLGIPIFLNFDPTHRLWVLGTASPTIYVLSKHIKSIRTFLTKLSIFTAENILCILHGQVFVMYQNGTENNEPKIQTYQQSNTYNNLHLAKFFLCLRKTDVRLFFQTVTAS